MSNSDFNEGLGIGMLIGAGATAIVGGILVIGLVGIGSDGETITIPENYSHTINAEAGDTLNIVMTPGEGVTERCNDMGGQLNYNGHTYVWTCKDVDF